MQAVRSLHCKLILQPHANTRQRGSLGCTPVTHTVRHSPLQEMTCMQALPSIYKQMELGRHASLPNLCSCSNPTFTSNITSLRMSYLRSVETVAIGCRNVWKRRRGLHAGI